jgi:hypothetical protein
MHSADYRLAKAITNMRLDEAQVASESRRAISQAGERDRVGSVPPIDRVLFQLGHGFVLLGEGLIRRGLSESVSLRDS